MSKKLEEIYTKAAGECIVENYYPNYDSYFSDTLFIDKSVEVTTDVAIKFALFIKDKCIRDFDESDKLYWDYNGECFYEPNDLFEIFINNYYES